MAEPLEEAISLVRDARENLAGTAPNTRDYYVQRGDAFANAQQDHDDRLARIGSVLEELASLYAVIIWQDREKSA